MNYRPSLRVQLMTIVTTVAFLLATMSPLSASSGPLASPKSPAAKAKPADNDNKDRRGSRSLNAMVQGVASDGTPFSGLLNITQFAVSPQGALNAVGTLAINAAGQTSAPQTVSIPVASIDPTCGILNLVLGPLNLTLLGLNISLNQVVLIITATSGSGDLLGNLLCAVANLLNPGSPLSSLLGNLTTLLNQIVASL